MTVSCFPQSFHFSFDYIYIICITHCLSKGKKTTAQNNMYPDTPLLRAALKPVQQKILHRSSTWRIQDESGFLPALLTMSSNTLIWRPFWFHIYIYICRYCLGILFTGSYLVLTFPHIYLSYLLVHWPLTWTLSQKWGVLYKHCTMDIF